MSLTAQQERFRMVSAEATSLATKHWTEFYGPSNFRADIGGVIDTEAMGNFAYFTLRTEDGILAGHLGMMLIRSPYYGKVSAMDIFYYVLPEFRGTTAICKLLRFGAQALQAAGVSQVVVSHPANKDLSVLMKRAGFNKTSDMYTFGG
jgi:hypothetical protein